MFKEESLNEGLKFCEEHINVFEEDKFQELKSLMVEIESTISIPYSKDTKEAQDDAYLELIQKYGKLVGDFKYNLNLTKKQYLTLKKFIFKKFVYDRESILLGVAVKNIIKNFDNKDDENTTTIPFEGEKEYPIQLEYSDFVRFISVTAAYKFPGLDGDAENFAVFMSKIIIISKVSEFLKKTGEYFSQLYNNKMLMYNPDAETETPTVSEIEPKI